jgi:hypothetical protein
MSDTTTTAPTTTESEPESGRHPVNVGHLVMGIALLGLVASWALIIGDVVEGDNVRWLLPTPWVLGGAAGLIALAVTGHRGRENRRVGWIAPAEPDTEAVEESGTEPTTDTESTTDIELTTEENK